MNKKELWLKIVQDLEKEITRANIITWFKNTAILEIGTGMMVIGLPLPMYLNWHETHYQKKTLERARAYQEDIQTIIYKIDTSLNGGDSRVIDLLGAVPVSKKKQRKLPNRNELKHETGIISKIMNERYSLDAYVVGPSNRLAHAACRAVASKPGGNYNPLFVYGGVGLGKTHLLQGTGNDILNNYPQKSVAYMTSEDFTNEVIQSIVKRKTDELRKRYRKLDVLIIDDIQFIANKDRTQEEFFHTFNALYQAGKQIIISSDRSPKELDILEPRLRSRFAMGMLADVSQPEFETRLAILLSKVQEKEMLVNNDTLEYIAYKIKNNVRELEGVLNQIEALIDFENRVPTRRDLDRMINSMHDLDQAPIGFETPQNSDNFVKNFDDLIIYICDYYNVSQNEVLGTSRMREYTLPRQIAMYLGKKKMHLALTKIASHFNRDHTSVMHAVRKVDREKETNRQMIRDLNTIKEECGLV